MNDGRAGIWWKVGLLALGLSGCAERPEAWSPVLEETSTTFLETETERIRGEVDRALEHLPSDPAEAEAALIEATRSLGHLQEFYLPLFRARERSYNAYRYFRLGDHGHVVRELEAIEGILASMVDRAEGGPLLELQGLAEAAADARMAVEAGQEEGGTALENLARALNQAVVKGDLILR